MHTIRNKIIVMTLALNFIVATGIGFYGLLRTEAILGDTQYKYAISIAHEMALEVEEYLAKHKGYLEGQTKALLFFDNHSKEFMEGFVKQLAEDQKDVLFAYYNTPNDSGFMVSSDGWEPPEGYSWEEHPWLVNALKDDRIQLGLPGLDSVTGRLVTVMRKRVASDEVYGVLNLAIALDELSGILVDFPKPSGSQSMILHKDGGIIALEDPVFLSGVHESIPKIEDLMPQMQIDKMHFALDGKSYFSVPLNDETWLLWLGIPSSYLSSMSLVTIGGFLLIYFLAGGFTIYYVRYFSRRISEPLDHLTIAAKEMAGGNYHFNLMDGFVERQDEIGILSKAFENMKENINHRAMELQALYEEMAAAEETLRENYDELECYKNKVEYFAFNNDKTGLPNREKLLQEMDYDYMRDPNSNKVLVVVGFKEYAHYFETLGQTAMEAIHKHLGEHINDILDELNPSAKLFDVNMGRFMIYSPIDTQCLEEWSEKLQKDVDQVHKEVGFQGHVTVRLGAYKIDYKDTPKEEQFLEAIEFAEMAFSYEHRVRWFDENMYIENKRENFIERELSLAIERGELYVVYQTKYDVNEVATSSEALVRWNHPSMGLVSPAVFVPMAERTGLIDAIDRFVVTSVVKRLASEREKGLTSLPIAVNLSILEMIDPSVVNKLNSIVSKYQVSPEFLILEVTETAFSKHLNIATENISRLKKAGYKIHLDDFGTGYSSLAYLNQFELDAIKIDISFTRQLLLDEKVKNIVQAIIDLSNRIGTSVIAEGVENEEQFKTLVAMGCDGFQGYYWGKAE